MPFVQPEQIKFDCTYNGKNVLNNDTGWVKSIDISVNENISPTVSSKINYQLNILE